MIDDTSVDGGRPAVAPGLDRLYRPRAVALVGASERPGSLPALALANLLGSGFEGAVHPVNPSYESVGGLRCYPSVASAPGPIDLALVLVAAGRTRDIVADCVEAGVAGIVLFAAGFAETGEEGRETEAEIVALARANGIRVLGPNCQGLVYRPERLVATFSAALSGGLVAPSGVAYVGQSGALGGSFFSLASERSIGITAWFSLGNQSDVTVCEMARELVADPAIRILALHLESLPSGGDWTDLARSAAALGKPLVVLRSGTSEAGRRAAASHSGAMISPDAGFELVAAREGAIMVTDVDELVHTVAQCLTGRRPGRSVGVLTSSGGAGAMVADRLAEAGLAVAQLTASTRAQLGEIIPAYGSTRNPVDVTAQLFATQDGGFGRACELLAADPNVEAVIVVLTNVVGPGAEHIARSLVAAAERTDKPLLVTWLSSRASISGARDILEGAGLLVHDSVKGPVRTLGRLVAGARARASLDGRGPLPPPRGLVALLPGGHDRILESEGAALLDRLGIVRPEQTLVTGEEQVAAAVRAVGGDAVLKIQSRDITHKSDIGGVVVGVAPDQAADAYRRMRAAVDRSAPGADVIGVLVQARAAAGLELLVGVKGSRNGYPPVVTVGSGGLATELLSDVASAPAPLSRASAVELLRRLRVWPLLNGFRGQAALDVGAVADALVACSEAAVELDDLLLEMEINPLIVYEHGVCATDLLVELAGR